MFEKVSRSIAFAQMRRAVCQRWLSFLLCFHSKSHTSGAANCFFCEVR